MGDSRLEASSVQDDLSGLRPRPGIMEINPYVGGKASLDAQEEVIKLSSNESALGPSPRAIEAFRQTAQELHRYPDGGSQALRSALGRRFNLDPEQLCCGAGSDELIALLTRAYAGPGDEVLYSQHGFLMYRLSALGAGAHPVAASEENLRASPANILAHVTSRTRLVFLANPNNPTGSYLPRDELAALAEALPPDVLFVIDSAYAECADAEDYGAGDELVRRFPNVVMLRTFSKLYGLAALRLGWMYADPKVIDVINRTRGPFNVSLPAQAAGIAALEDVAHQNQARAHNTHWRRWVSEELNTIGLKVHPSLGNFVLIEFPEQSGQSAADANTYLERHGLIPRLVASYGLPHCLRVSIGLEHENRRLVELLQGFVRESGIG
ncbi:MAG: histidinol-phosphate transaminase [Pseudomonadota bacterium]